MDWKFGLDQSEFGFIRIENGHDLFSTDLHKVI